MAKLFADLSGKVALVTGAASGLVKEIALAMARSGATLGVADLNLEGATAVAQQIHDQGGRAVGVLMDVTSESAVNAGVDSVVQEFGALDIVVSNAGVQIVSSIVDSAYADWRKMQAIHVDGAFLTTKAALRHMYKDSRCGVVT